MNPSPSGLDSMTPERMDEKAGILESNLKKAIAGQKDPVKRTLTIERAHYPDLVIAKALVQLMPRYNIQPSAYLMPLRELLAEDLHEEDRKTIESPIDLKKGDEFDDVQSLTRMFKASVSKKKLIITIEGIRESKSMNGDIGKSFFNHTLCAGKMLKNGGIDFREINKFPVVNAGDDLFYMIKEEQGRPGISFDGTIIAVKEAVPYPMKVGTSVEQIDDLDASGRIKGYYLRSLETGVILLSRDKDNTITGIDVKGQVEIKKLDFSTGNIGTEYTCPISLKVGEICSEFQIRVNGRVDAGIIDGGRIITNNSAHILKIQSGSSVLALKDISAGFVIHSSLVADRGTITIENELIDSELTAPAMVFEKKQGLVTNSVIRADKVSLKGCYFSAETLIYFGSTLFEEEAELLQSFESVSAKLAAPEKRPGSLTGPEKKRERLEQDLLLLKQKMDHMSLDIEGSLRRGASIKIYCGFHGSDKKNEPDLIVDSESNGETQVNVCGTYSAARGFELTR